ncbi:Dirigent protein 9 [Forsythia ovata]|uniref:Dirigent protein n=1 Tax=Forsythia ovata TaxID=205694 RepID=A0ABD1WIG3_9LAMI
MAKLLMLASKPLKSIICLFLLATTFLCASSARILDDFTPQIPFPANIRDSSDPTETDNPNVAPASTLPSGQFPATTAGPVTPTEPAAPVVAPAADTPDIEPAPATNLAPVATTTLPSGAVTTGSSTTTSATPANAIPEPPPLLSFFMHDILGGSHPSGRVVTGIVANSDANNLPFSKPNNQIFPINGGVPLNTINGVINNNNFPFLVGLNGSPTNTAFQNSGNNNIVNGGNNQAFVTAGQLPAGLTLQQLMFGSVTVVDNEITEGHELGSAVLGKAQGFYLTSSSDGSSHTLALTALFHGQEHEVDDNISFFGVHRTATPISHIAIIGGTGKYENAKGYATIETLPHEDQHTTDGLETITHFTIYLTP